MLQHINWTPVVWSNLIVITAYACSDLAAILLLSTLNWAHKGGGHLSVTVISTVRRNFMEQESREEFYCVGGKLNVENIRETKKTLSIWQIKRSVYLQACVLIRAAPYIVSALILQCKIWQINAKIPSNNCFKWKENLHGSHCQCQKSVYNNFYADALSLKISLQ